MKSAHSENVLYLLDANVLIRAHEDYYPLDRVPQFWAWLELQARADRIRIPSEIHAELTISHGPLGDWARSVKASLVLDEAARADLVQRVLSEGYADDLTDSEAEEIGQDPFLIAYGLRDTASRIVVTKEVSKPSKTRANRNIPDVCMGLGITCINDFELFRRLNFRT